MPSTKFTGDRRVCAYLDTSEPQHKQSSATAGITPPMTPLFSPSFNAMILGLNSPAAGIRVHETVVDRPGSGHGI
ncbi:hypothetical protein L1987_49912 [Smallanthus sonchifolius]|uniref:Uncharacterized protein n=1 Tax=Smallanthus sonchifolius TaxID=185202 RepID=A0ACB9FX10_9ASTR|nr:hypothetical protein L1987_49912 [Smallanthus sonchifolius]